jgi:DNA-binding NarL/FixJ family response regulator
MDVQELTEGERDLLQDYGRLGTIPAVAEHRERAVSTIKNELGKIYRKLGVPSGVAAVWATFVEPMAVEE